MSLLSWFGLKTPAPSAPQNTWSLTNTAFPASPRSPSRPLSRMGCGGDYRFQSRGRTAVGFYHPAGRPTASPAGYFYAQLSGPVLLARSGAYRRARGRSGDRIVMRTPSENDDSYVVDFEGLSISPHPFEGRYRGSWSSFRDYLTDENKDEWHS